MKSNHLAIKILISGIVAVALVAGIYFYMGAGQETSPAPVSESKVYKERISNSIRQNIADLSPKEPVLGGSFYVTDMEFLDGNRILVSYEDGHIALTAIAHYEMLPDGSVRIDRFELQEDQGAAADFRETGNLTRQNGNWVLVYEEAGKPALTAVLVFDDESSCAGETPDGSCLPAYWEVGDRAEVVGEKMGESVKVISLRIIGETSRDVSGGGSDIESFDECMDAGYEVMYPDCVGCQPYCETPDGQRFEQESEDGDSICVDNCGNGICEDVVCFGEGCPCAETPESCPQDCE